MAAEQKGEPIGAEPLEDSPFSEELAVPYGEERRFLLFALGEARLAIELSRLEEILEPGPVTRAPGAPPWVLGAANLRGQALPVIDLAAKLGLGARSAADGDEGSRPAILVFRPGAEAARIGIRVSAVMGFVEVGESAFGPPPRFGGPIASELIAGLVALADRFVPVLDLSLALSGENSGAVPAG